MSRFTIKGATRLHVLAIAAAVSIAVTAFAGSWFSTISTVSGAQGPLVSGSTVTQDYVEFTVTRSAGTGSLAGETLTVTDKNLYAETRGWSNNTGTVSAGMVADDDFSISDSSDNTAKIKLYFAPILSNQRITVGGINGSLFSVAHN